MADQQLFTASDLVNAYKLTDPSKISDVNRILAALPGGASGTFTLEQLQAVGSPARGTGGIAESGLTGLSGRSLSAFQGALATLGRTATNPFADFGGIEGLTASQLGLIGAQTDAIRQAMAFAKEGAAIGKKVGGEISGISRGFLNESTPLRKALIGSTEAKLGLPVSPGATVSPVALFGPRAPERAAIENQYQIARNQVIENTPSRGGQLNAALNVLPENRARAISAMEAAATDKAVGLATDIGLGTRFPALAGIQAGGTMQLQGLGMGAATGIAGAAGFGNAASGYNDAANRAQAYQFGNMQYDLASATLLQQAQLQSSAQNAAKKSSTGQGVGSGAGGILGALISNIGSSGGGGGGGGGGGTWV